MTRPTHDPTPPGTPAIGVPTPPPRAMAAGAASSLAGTSLGGTSLSSVREQMAALLRMQEQTAALHRQFLESQQAAQHTIEGLLDQQRALLGLAPATTHSATAMPAAPAPIAAAPVPVAAAPEFVPVRDSDGPAQGTAPTSVSPDLTASLLEVVSDKTGYPVEMLEPSMEMDADLGIDSIKRVEILAAMQERVPGLPAVASDELGALRTLADVVAILGEAAPSVVAAPAVTVAGPDLSPILLEVVAEKTGYPAEMLELSMEMDADLGIDSIKRVEILAAMQERVPGLPAVASDELGALRTLADVVAILDSAAPSASATGPAQGTAPTSISPDLAALLLDVVGEKTGYPAEMLELSMEMDADLGIDSIKRVEILAAMQERAPGLPAVESDELGRLRTLADVVAILTSGPAAPAPEAAPAAPSSGIAATQPLESVDRHVLASVALGEEGRERLPIAPGEILVAGDGDGLGGALAAALTDAGHDARVIDVASDGATDGAIPESLAGLVLVASADGGNGAFLRAALTLVTRASAALQATPGALLATVSRLDGAFGLADLNGADPASGGLAGLAKTASHEWPAVVCKALDVPAHVDDIAAAARAVADEILLRGPLEVGLTGTERLELRLDTQPVVANGEAPLSAGDLVVVTGGARGVTAESAVALASAFRPALLLLGRSPEPEDEPSWLSELDTEAEIKRALATRMNGSGSLKAVEAEYRRIVGARAIRETLGRCADAGATATYRSIDVRDREAVAAVIDEARTEHGPLRGIVHGAGVLRDALIEQKTPEQFDDVYGTKVDGLRALLAAAGDDELRAIVLFSSSTGRFGRTGQVDYAIANEVLNKIAQREHRRRVGCRVVSVNWGPWAGGMVTDAHKRIFAEEGIGLIGLRAGAEYLVQELSAGADAPVEVVVLGPGSSALAAQPAPVVQNAAKQAVPATSLPLAFDRVVDAKSHPVLTSHVLDGRPVVPVVLMMQWLAHGALHANPGLRFHGVLGFRMLHGIPLGDDAATVHVHAGGIERKEDGFRVATELRGTDEKGRERLLARAEILLVDRLPKTNESAAFQPADAPCSDDRAAIYEDQLFHGPGLQGLRSVPHLSTEGVVAESDTAPAPAVWVREPLRGSWLGDPLAIDVAFQAMVVWSRAHCGAPSLPTGFTGYRQFVASFPREGVRISARVTSSSEHAAHADIDFTDADGNLVARMTGYECVVDASLEHAYKNRTLAGAARG